MPHPPTPNQIDSVVGCPTPHTVKVNNERRPR
jgi:hypothetical protein